MCGLAGVIAWDERLAPTREVLSAMAARLAHRGPDFTGVWLSEASGESSGSVSQCGLAHCRLSILDLSPRANQPMHDPSGQLHLVFNGEIYNFRELREELTGLLGGYAWQTTSDTEVILAAWRAWGRQCVDHFNGMFAIALWDQAKQVLFLTRDRIGQKPLFVGTCTQGDATRAVAFVSELGALAPVPWLPREVDLRAIADYFAWGYIPAPRTVYRDVISLPPGHCMQISAGKVETWRYFDPNAAGRMETATGGLAGKLTGEAPADTTRRLLCQAVKRQLVSDVPLGCFLSGGIDSSCLVAAMRQAMPDGQPVKTFTIAFDDAQYDESAYANRVALHLGTQHEKFTVRFDAAEDLPRLARAFGEPFADSSALPTHILSRLTRSGVKVALSGDGGDELFGGYDRYRAMALHARLPRWATAALGWRMWQCLPGSHPKSKAARFKRFAESAGQDAATRYAGYMRLFSESQCRELMGAELAGYFPEAGGDPDRADEDLRVPRGAGAYLPDLFGRLSEGRDDVQTAMAVDRFSYLPEDLLTKVDRCSMQHALEVRCPFMDHDLVAFAAGLPGSLLLQGGPKRLLRDAFSRDLPEGLFDRPKMGFALPIGQWLRTCLKPMLMDHLGSADSFASRYLRPGAIDRLIRQHDSRAVDHSQRLYALLMLELWWATLS